MSRFVWDFSINFFETADGCHPDLISITSLPFPYILFAFLEGRKNTLFFFPAKPEGPSGKPMLDGSLNGQPCS